MGGVNFRFEVDDHDVKAALNRLIDAGIHPRPAFKQVGEYLIQVHEKRFDDQVGPDGNAWAPLTEDYKRSKRKMGSRGANLILVLNRTLARYFIYQFEGDDLFFSTSQHTEKYAATQQFGRPAANIPARPFMGVNADNSDHIIGVFNRYLKDTWEQAGNLV
jgi:phage virion morphogenesis protein